MFVDFNAFRGDLKEVVANPERDLLAGRVEAGWRLRVTRATSSTGVKGGLQNEEGNGATPNISCPAEAAERVEPMLR